MESDEKDLDVEPEGEGAKCREENRGDNSSNIQKQIDEMWAKRSAEIANQYAGLKTAEEWFAEDEFCLDGSWDDEMVNVLGVTWVKREELDLVLGVCPDLPSRKGLIDEVWVKPGGSNNGKLYD